ncbi:hypothetical protein [Massilioclostridium coli]|uniref:hypothetical protein n=1 Tax=Massilioclostridium coli TaxID=1870991 RepID=UPI0013566E8F|nr:hypothetical protein [Massilioclostridium coli]
MLNEYIISPLWAVVTLVLCGTIFGSCTVALICTIYHGLKERRKNQKEQIDDDSR